MHFGVNTFTGLEWGTGDEDPDVFQPVGLDTDQWARALRDGGFKLAILAVKHHDGFVLYPSRYTNHSVASSSWRAGQGDVLRSFADSMRRYGIKVGVYISPADENQYLHGVYANGSARSERTVPTPVDGDDRTDRKSFTLQATDYGAHMLNQLYEVLTEYGPVDEVWFDGAQGRIPPDKGAPAGVPRTGRPGASGRSRPRSSGQGVLGHLHSRPRRGTGGGPDTACGGHPARTADRGLRRRGLQPRSLDTGVRGRHGRGEPDPAAARARAGAAVAASGDADPKHGADRGVRALPLAGLTLRR